MTKKKPSETPAEINRRNRKFWKKTSAEFESNIMKRPRDAEIAAEQEADALLMAKAGGGERWMDSALKMLPSMENRVADLARSHSFDQQEKAKKPRPKRRPTCRTVTIELMRRARADGQTFQSFLDAAMVESVEGVTIQEEVRGGIARFVVAADAVTETSDVSKSTLGDWWAVAGSD